MRVRNSIAKNIENPDGWPVNLLLVPMNLSTNSQKICNGLVEEECVQLYRYLLHEDRVRFGLTRVELHLLLGGLMNIEPLDVKIMKDHNRRPVMGGEATSVDFSVSHSGDFSLIGWLPATRTSRIGVDIEKIINYSEVSELVELIMTDSEMRRAEDMESDLFSKIWTIKESILKAVGLGFMADAKKIEAQELADGTLSAITLIEGHEDLVASLIQGPAGYSAAVAWRP